MKVELGKGAREEEGGADGTGFAASMRLLRRRRLYVWIVVGSYLPLMWVALRATGSFNGALAVFAGWMIVLFAAVFAAALARCPGCGKHFHMNGMTLLLLRRCLHCQLHVNGEKST